MSISRLEQNNVFIKPLSPDVTIILIKIQV